MTDAQKLVSDLDEFAARHSGNIRRMATELADSLRAAPVEGVDMVGLGQVADHHENLGFKRGAALIRSAITALRRRTDPAARHATIADVRELVARAFEHNGHTVLPAAVRAGKCDPEGK